MASNSTTEKNNVFETSEDLNVEIAPDKLDLFSMSQWDVVNLILNKCIIPILCFSGVAGNVIILKVLKHHRFSDSTDILLYAMTASDMILAITEVIDQVIVLMNVWDTVITEYMRLFFMLFIFEWNRRSFYFSICTLALIALEKMAMLSFPDFASRMFTSYRVKWSVTVLVTISYVFTFPQLYLIHEYSFHDRMFIKRYTVFFTSHMTAAKYMYEICVFVILYLPSILIILSTSAIIVITSLRSLAFRMSTPRGNQMRVKDLKHFKLLSCIFSLKIISLFPYISFALTSTFNVPLDATFATYNVLDSLVRVFGVSFSSFNAIIFVALSSKALKSIKLFVSLKVRTK